MSNLHLTAICAGLCALNVYLGFVRPPRVFRRHAQAAAPVFFLLTVFTAYFGWRETRAVDELAALIDPVPGLTAATYVPTPGEIHAVAKALSAIPGTGRAGTTRQEREALARSTGDQRTRYWQVETTLEPESVTSFYRDEANRDGWAIGADYPPYLVLTRGSESLTIHARDDRLHSKTEVWYTYQQREN